MGVTDFLLFLVPFDLIMGAHYSFNDNMVFYFDLSGITTMA